MVALQFSIWALFLGPVVALWPQPSSISTGTDALFINKDIEVTFNDAKIEYRQGYEPSTINGENVVQGGVSRALDTIFNKGLYPWMFHPRNESQSFQPDLSQRSFLKSLDITQTGKDDSNTFKPVAGKADESYELNVGFDGKATISAASAIGILRALETFTQLFYTHSNGKDFYTPYVPVDIKDEPKFPHRGVLLDTSRNFYPVEAILRTIDGCAASKLNVFHWHITDSQSWPLEIPALPDLSAKGAYRPDMVYTPKDIERIQKYSAARGVQVIVEIDQPGHTTSVGFSHPELVAAMDYEPYTAMCAEPPCGSLRLNDSAVDKFLDTLMDDLLPRLRPHSAYFHNGGDEFQANNSLVDPTVGTNNTNVVHPLLQAFSDKAAARVRKAGMTPFVWEEIPLEWNVTLGNDVVVTTWLGEDSISKVIDMGNKVVDINFNYLYLPCGNGQWLTFQPGSSFQFSQPFVDWYAPTKNWERVYSYQPTKGLSDKQAEKMLGSEAAVWSEATDEGTVDRVMWPRASVLGEVLWTGPLNDEGRDGDRDLVTAAPRINELRERLVARGVGADRLQMAFCTMGGDCVQPV